MQGDVGGALRVAVLEQDVLLRERILVPRLREHGFDATGLEDIAALERQMSACPPDMLLLDTTLSGADAFALSRSLRQRFPGVGIVMLGGSRTGAERIRGLAESADAFLVKPLEIELAVATLHSVARRLAAGTSAMAGVACAAAPVPGWRLDASEWRLLAPCGAGIPLSRSERPLVRCLVRNAGQVVARDALIASLTGDAYSFDPHRLDSLVHRLRRKVVAVSQQPLPLSAVHGQGYVFTG